MSISIGTSPLGPCMIEQIAQIAAEGFGRPNDEHNYHDTVSHVDGLDHVQLAKEDQQLVGFALYRRCLWREGN